MTTIGLAMLVKDEAQTLPRTLPTMLPAIDAVTIMDTGSSDDTIKVARELCRDTSCIIVRTGFEGFGPSRTALLQTARTRADYTLMLDADHTLHIHGDRPNLTADAYRIKIEGNLEWRLPLLTRSAHPFRYAGAAHSYLDTDEPARFESTDWLSIDGGGGVTREKLQRDRLLLEEEFAHHPDDPRTVFYLAQTYRDLDLPKKAIRLYLLRAEMGGFEEERWYARYQAGILLGAHVEGLQGAEQLVKAWRERPSRAEALRALSHLAAAVADKLEKPDDMLFVTPSAYGRHD